MESIKIKINFLLLFCLLFLASKIHAGQGNLKNDPDAIRVEYLVNGNTASLPVTIPLSESSVSGNIRISSYHNESYNVLIHEIDRGAYTEINGELKYLRDTSSCVSLRIILPCNSGKWKWFRGLDKSVQMSNDGTLYDTTGVRTVIPPAGAFNGQTLGEGGYGCVP
jgi:hypothetical protein